MTTSTLSSAIPTFSAADLRARATQRRAVEALIWGIPAVNFDLMYQSFVRDAKGTTNQIAYWSRIPDWNSHARQSHHERHVIRVAIVASG
jgi:hypothetical protein